MKTRQEINKQILKLLSDANENMGDQRFCQLLVNCGVTYTAQEFSTLQTVSYHEESVVTLERMEKEKERIFGSKK